MGCLNSLTQSCLMSILRRAHISNLFRGMWDYCWFMRLLGLWFTVDLVTTDSDIDTCFSLYFRHSLAPSFTPFFYLVTNSYLNVYMTYIQKHGSGMVKKKKDYGRLREKYGSPLLSSCKPSHIPWPPLWGAQAWHCPEPPDRQYRERLTITVWDASALQVASKACPFTEKLKITIKKIQFCSNMQCGVILLSSSCALWQTLIIFYIYFFLIH